MSNGRLIASGPTIYGSLDGWQFQRAEARLPSGVKSCQVDIEATAGVAGIFVATEFGASTAGLYCETLTDENVLKWGAWPPSPSPATFVAGTGDRGAAYTMQVTLKPDGTFTLRVNGKTLADGIRAGPASHWNNGIPVVSLYARASAVGVILKTRFSNVRALAR